MPKVEPDRERSGTTGRAAAEPITSRANDRQRPEIRPRVAITISLLLALCLVVLTACETARFEVIYVSLDPEGTAGEPGRITVRLDGRSTPPCPQLVGDVVATVNGASLSVHSMGGEASDPDVRYGTCDPAELHIEPAIVGGPIRVVVDDAERRVEVEVEWPERHDIWTDDDLALAMRDRRDFIVRWVPADSDAPTLSVYAGSSTQDVEVVEVAPGTASFRFSGDAPTTAWTVVASTRLERAPTTCVGVATCVVSSSIHRAIATDLPPTPAE